jgi:hypothetical protein
MKQPISKSGVYAAANRTIKTRKPEVVALMQKYGMAVSENDSDSKIDKAFFALLPRSRGFRNDFSTLASEVASGMTVGELSMTGYLNQDGTGSKTTKTAKDFNETQVGQILSNESIKNLLNTGLSVWAYKRTGGGVGGAPTDNILGSATITTGTPTNVPPTGGKEAPKKDEPKGTDLGWLLFVGIGAVVLGGGYLIYKSVNK